MSCVHGDEVVFIATGLTMLVTRATLLMVGIRGDRLLVYRSVAVQESDPMFQPVKDLIGDAEPLVRDEVTDPGMMFGSAEYSIYAFGGVPDRVP
ncbi:hypothetical protein KIV66_gp72 [Mycobacterium phage MyraDee]|uniref:Uncharacterized protein n=1 Tax=Mycobacterium phage MyraDee TaxID=2024303 RepID=A0A222YY29_9CAUD|nr:hypothetical protein KIV66_gp72 [Mycobacterium phage MyraDee]ASR77179.1 hypothetical protein SEA_MYRADEE_72 [Mycobacterium phage MyraDee]